MTDPDILDDRSDDHEQFETELLAQDRDAVRVATADIDETTARQLVNNGVVTAVADQRVLLDSVPAPKAGSDDTGRSVI